MNSEAEPVQPPEGNRRLRHRRPMLIVGNTLRWDWRQIFLGHAGHGAKRSRCLAASGSATIAAVAGVITLTAISGSRMHA
jgi:hypothetical protein